jgi:hypothetical protein
VPEAGTGNFQFDWTEDSRGLLSISTVGRGQGRPLPSGSLDFAFLAAHNAQQFGEFDEQVRLKERSPMRAFRIGGYWLMLFPLLGILGCTSGVQTTTIPTNCNATTKNCSVSIDTHCIANPDQQDVPLGYTVTWQAPDSTYSAQFLKAKTPFQTSTGKQTVVPAGSPSKPVSGDNSCGTTPNPPPSSTNAGCYFYYDVYQGNKLCGDPGIHVVN